MTENPPMGSWRDSVSQPAQEDLDALLDEALPFAQKMLDEHGEFFPYAVAMETSGETRLVAGDPDLGEQPDSTEVLRVLIEGLRSERIGLRSAAIVSDVRVSGTDAIRVEVEHQDGSAVSVFLPYQTKRLRRGVSYGELAAATGECHVWMTEEK